MFRVVSTTAQCIEVQDTTSKDYSLDFSFMVILFRVLPKSVEVLCSLVLQ